ncbi:MULTISPECIES: tyrosine recombinase XerC [unclassified Arthrobacter]|uniref:site-specific integrase n=1 Tax=unclassified Arthrobacter TaxID=235627 RepID=UPI0015E303CF|nr:MULTISPECIES: tyrosine-type recombinase/integrase [unclassified Arthrobacter]
MTVTESEAGTFQAFCRYRDMDGKTRRVTATGRTKRAANDALTAKLSIRSRGNNDALTPESRVKELASTWLAQHEASPGALEQYAGTIDRHITPKIGSLRIRELTTSRADKFLELVGTKHAGTHTKADGTPVLIGGPTAALTARVVLTQMFSMAVRYGLCEVNPVREARTPKSGRKPVKAINAEMLQALLDHVREWAEGGTYGPARDQDVLDMIEVLVGTGIRPGEVLALRWSDGVDLSEDPSIEVTGTAKRTKERGLHRQEHPKTDSSERQLRLPGFVVSVLRRRRLRAGGNDYVFPNRDGELREPANFNRVWRSARGEEWAWVTPKSFRAAVATIIDREADSESAASQLGHRSDLVTRKHYIEHDKMATDNRVILERFRDVR